MVGDHPHFGCQQVVALVTGLPVAESAEVLGGMEGWGSDL